MWIVYGCLSICTGNDWETVGWEVDDWWMINCDEGGSSCSMELSEIKNKEFINSTKIR